MYQQVHNRPRQHRRRLTAEERQAMAQAALERAHNASSLRNMAFVIECFQARGIMDVRPGENVLTFWAWKAKGRHVRKGEHGVKIPVVIQTADHEAQAEPDTETDTGKGNRRVFGSAVVFHESQTEENEVKA